MPTKAAPAKKSKSQKAAPAPRHPAPDHLGAEGTSLWTEVVRELESHDSDDGEIHFDARELYLLEQAAHVADRIGELDRAVDADGPTATGGRGQITVHPGISEGRQLRVAQVRLLGSLEIGPPDAGPSTAKQKRAQKASRARWDRKPRRVDDV